VHIADGTDAAAFVHLATEALPDEG